MEDKFDKIIKHLNRKKSKKNEKLNGEMSKPIIEIDGNDLYCWHGYAYLYIHYDDEKAYNPYSISIERQCVFARFQTIGTAFYTDEAPEQEDVIECIRHRF